MSKVVKFSPKRKKPPAGKAPQRKIGRDFFAVLVVGLGIGLSLAWMGIDQSAARVLLTSVSTKVQELASNLPSPADGTESADDASPVSSIGKKASPDADRRVQRASSRYFPVCGIDVFTRENCVIDGDTFYFRGTTIRISDIDAPETHPSRCAHEADLGDRATRRLSQLLSAGAFQLVRANRDVDKYGRQLRVVIRDGRSIGRILVTEGLARTWSGKRRPWCDGQNSPAG